jgi:hypothetical protein
VVGGRELSTLLAWHLKLIAMKWDYSARRGRTGLASTAAALILTQAYAAHPEHFGGGSRPRQLPMVVWINEPRPETELHK